MSVAKEEAPIGYVKVYNPIMVAAALVVTVQTIAYTIITFLLYVNPDVPDRQIQAFNIWTNLFQVGISFGLWYITYKYAKISEEPLQKLRRLANDAEVALEWWETLTFALSPVMHALKDFKNKFSWPTSSSEVPKNNNKAPPPQVQALDVGTYLERYTNALVNIDRRLRDMESHVRRTAETEDEPEWGTENLK